MDNNLNSLNQNKNEEITTVPNKRSTIPKLIFLALVIGGAFYGGMYFTKNKEEKKEEPKAEEKQPEEQPTNTTTVCNGPFDAVYEGEYHVKEVGYTVDEYRTFTLKKDGTYSTEVKDGDGNSGKYTLKDNKLSITFKKTADETVTLVYAVSPDCSKITYGIEGEYQYDLNLKGEIDRPSETTSRLEDINFMRLDELNLYLQMALEKDKTENRYKFENLNNGDELLNKDSKKFDFAYAYAVNKASDVLKDNAVADKLKVPAASGLRAVPLTEMKKVYKELYGVELGDANKYPSNNIEQGKVQDGYILGSYWTMIPNLGTKLEFDSLTNEDNTYYLTLNILYYDESSGEPSYTKSKDQLNIKLHKNNDIYYIKSITIKK